MNAEQWHNRIYKVSEEANVKPDLVFKAVYIALLGKESGPRAGWLLTSLDQDFIKKRFLDASYATYFTPYSLVYWLLSEGIENKEGRKKEGYKKGVSVFGIEILGLLFLGTMFYLCYTL